jgi:hypothetical protein
MFGFKNEKTLEQHQKRTPLCLTWMELMDQGKTKSKDHFEHELVERIQMIFDPRKDEHSMNAFKEFQCDSCKKCFSTQHMNRQRICQKWKAYQTYYEYGSKERSAKRLEQFNET